MKIYVAGPMRGYAQFNFPAFESATRDLRALGHEVFSPAERDRGIGFHPDQMAGTEEEMASAGFDLREALGTDLAWICAEADAVVLLPGWSTSLGARAERFTARALGLPVFLLEDFIG